MSSPGRLTFLFTVRAGDRFRRDNCHAVTGWYRDRYPSAEFIIVEQDTRSRIDAAAFPPGVRHLLARNPGLFNKAWGINVGFRCSAGDILVVADTDMLVESAGLQRTVDAVERELDIARPYRYLIDMTREQSRGWLDGGELPSQPVQDHGFGRYYQGEQICLAGGLFVIRRKFFEQLGGFDERFRGWGGEDDAFSLRAEAVSTRCAIARDGVACHLWHPRQASHGKPAYHHNLALLGEYQRWRSGEPGADVPVAPHPIGDPERYHHESA